MIIENASIFQEDGFFEKGTLYCIGEHFVSPHDYQKEDDIKIDASGCYAIPGLIDVHFHGCNGVDFCDGTKDSFHEIITYQASHGITGICPATMTLPEEELLFVLSSVQPFRNDKGAELLGIHLEGPFLNPQKKGAQNEDNISSPDLEYFNRLYHASAGLLKIISLAPEMVGALPFIDEIKDKVLVSIAHTNADYHTASQAFAHGAKQVTHLYNAMPPFSHREPGVIGAAFDAKDTMVEIICDGVHIHPSVVRATLQLFGTDRVIFVSDSMRATGLQDGSYTLGGQPVFVKDKRATLSDGTIAGSVTNLMDCVRNAVFHMGIPLEAALTCSCANPAKAIGAFEHYGSLSVGKYCNVVLLEQDSLNVRGVYIRGKEFTRISSSTYTSCK